MKCFLLCWLVLSSALLTLLPQSVFGQVNIAAGGSITEGFTIGNATTASLPTGWKVDAQGTARTLGTYAGAVTTTTRSGGANIASGAATGVFNFGAGTDNLGTDRAIGGISAGASNRTINLYLDLLNNGTSSIPDFTISYNVEKYRLGMNAAGFTIQMYYSTDGSTWTPAGADFVTNYPTDGGTVNSGVSPAPLASATTSISSKNLAQTLNPNSHLYLAWSYSVSSNADGSNAQGLGVDDITIVANSPVPTISTSTAILPFNNVFVNTSSIQSFSVGGSNLTNDIIITPPNSDYKIRTGSNAFDINPITLTQSGGSVATTTIDVEFTPTAIQSYPATINITSNGATQKDVTLSGAGIAVSAPTVTTTAISGITLNAAVSGGNVTSDGGTGITARGIVWSTASNPDVSLGTKSIESGTTGTYTSNISGLTPGTLYYVRAYATNSQGTSYGSEVTFTSLKNAPTVQASGLVFTNVKARTITVGWTNGTDGERRLVKINTSNSFTDPVDGTSYTSNSTYGGGEQVVYNGTGSSIKVTGLTENTTYWFRVYEFNNNGTVYTRYYTAVATNNPLSQTTTALQVAPKIIISQVYEGVSSDKWIEITNIGTTTVDLGTSDLTLGMYSISGSTGNGLISGSPSNTFDLFGTLAPNSSLLLRHTSAALPAYASAAFVNGSVNNFNGNDALVLLINSTDVMDAFGDGLNNVDKSFHRNYSVTDPNATFTLSEWTETTLATVENATVLMSARLGVHSFPNNPLPVSLISFDAKAAGNKVALTWATASEKDNKHFDLQRSNNGDNFTTIITVAGKGTTNQIINYQAFDDQPLNGLSYYRLKQIDFDGTESFSKIVAVNSRSVKGTVAVYPNPAGNNLTVSFTGEAKSIAIMNMLGQEILNQSLLDPSNSVKMDIATLPAGAYQVIVTTVTGRSTQKFVKIAQ